MWPERSGPGGVGELAFCVLVAAIVLVLFSYLERSGLLSVLVRNYFPGSLVVAYFDFWRLDGGGGCIMPCICCTHKAG